MKIQYYRRFQKHKNRFVYQDTRSWRSYYTTHAGTISAGDRTDEMDRFLGPWEMFTGQLDKNNNPIYVGDFLRQDVPYFNPLTDDTDVYLYHVLWDNDIKAIRFPQTDDLAEFTFASDIEFDEVEIFGNVHQNTDFYDEESNL
jgi:hypothetical protein